MRSVTTLHRRGVSALWCLTGLFALTTACAPQDGDDVGGQPVVSIHPSTTTLTAGSEQVFSALVDGVPTDAVWSVESGTGSITAEGVYTAPVVPGTYRVVARVGGHTATVEVRVVQAPAVELFAAEPADIDGGGTSRLRAKFGGGTGVIDNGIGAVASPVDLEVRPAATTIYTLRVTNEAGFAIDRSTTVVVDGIPPEVTVTITPREASTTTAGTIAFAAEVHGTSNQGVAWAVEEAGGGSIDASGTYAPPATPGVYHVTATSVADPTSGDRVSVTVTEASVVTVTVSPRTTSVAAGASTTFTATVTGTSDTTVAWKVVETGGGSVTSAGVYAAPASAGTYHVTATSVADPTKSDTATVDVTAAGALVVPDSPGAADVQIALDTRSRRPISRLIYGLNLAEDGVWGTIPANVGLSRFGGNRLTCYNWETNASNAGVDWNYQSDAHLVLGGDMSLGAATKRRADFAFSRGAAFMATVPNIGYVAKDMNGPVSTPFPNLSRFIVSAPRNPAGATAKPSTTDNVVYQDDFVKWLDTTYPNAKNDPQETIVYSLDNEPDLWHETHGQVRSAVPSWQEITQRNIEYAAAIKDVVPQAKVVGPAHYGWSGMRSMQGGAKPAGTSYAYFFDYYFDELRKAESQYGRRLVDAFDFHWYSEARSAANVRITGGTETSDMITARVQATRSLWDPEYVENSWIANGSIPDCSGSCPIRLLPRLKEHIAARYPGTKLAMTERSFGGNAYISGAIAEADLLGIFAREEMYAAALWPRGSEFRCIFAGWRAFLDYDGAKSRFGDLYVSTSVSDAQRTASVERVTAYGSIDPAGDGRAVVIAINKTQSSLTTGLAATANTRYGHAEVYRVTASGSPTSAGCTGPTRQADVEIGLRNAFRATLPPLSITVFVLRP